MSGDDILLRDPYVLDPREGLDGMLDVRIRGGVVTELGDGLPADGSRVVDCAGRHLFPAFFDPHVHLRTPGQEYKETIASGTAAAAAGGFCAVVAMPNTAPTVDDASIVRALVDRARREGQVQVHFLAAITPGLRGERLTEMFELREAGALGFTDDGKPVVDAGLLRLALQYQRLAGGLLCLHEEDPSLSGDGVMHEGDVSAVLGLAGIPSVSESTMIARDAAIADYEGARIHIQHLSAIESVVALRQTKDAGVRITGEVTPHHLTLTDEHVRSLDTNLKMNPPLRSELDRKALIDGLRDGTIDCVATDHAPHALSEKEVPWEQAAMGTTGLETAFAALHTSLVVPGLVPLDVLVHRMTAGADVLGLATSRVAVGAPANLTLAHLDAEWKVGEDGYASRSSNCCFHNQTLRGRVELTMAAGRVVYERIPVAT